MGGNPPGMHRSTLAVARALGKYQHLRRESHIDALAAKAGVDPLEFRLKHLSDKRMIRVLQTAADKFAWKPGKEPSGRAWVFRADRIPGPTRPCAPKSP